jgi:UDP-N-acetylglucosamine/UDP-N-acetylgalactosamine 4-epimerase
MLNTNLNFENLVVLVTGGAGFIGSHLVDALLERGAVVRVLDDFSTGRRENLQQCSERIELIEGDICDVEICRRACAGARYVFHEAALGSVPRSMQDPARSLAVNVAGTANVLTAARDARVARVVYASSSSVYGDSERLPKREGQEGRALSPYALSKQMDELLADTFARCFGMTLVGLRYFNVYGPRQDPNGPYAAVVPRFLTACAGGHAPTIFGDGRQSRDFTFVGDVVRANLLAAATPELSGARVFNIGAGGETTVVELAWQIIRASGAPLEPQFAPPRDGDVAHSRADASAAERDLGFRASVTLEQGLQRTLQGVY